MFSWEDENGKTDSVKMVGMVGDSDFIPALGLTLLKGETFGANPDHYWDGSYAKESPIVINETAWKMLKVENPVGMLLTGGGIGIRNSRVVGVVKDFNFQPLREKIKPAFFYYTVQYIEAFLCISYVCMLLLGKLLHSACQDHGPIGFLKNAVCNILNRICSLTALICELFYI